MLNFESFCYAYTSDLTGPVDINDTYTIEDIAKSLKDDLGIDYDHWLEHEYLDRNFWVELYDGWAKLWHEQEIDGLKAIGRAYAPVVNKLQNETEDIFLPKEAKNTINKKYAIYEGICYWSYHIILISFCSAVLSMVIGYVNS